jgi:hypothetical protein
MPKNRQYKGVRVNGELRDLLPLRYFRQRDHNANYRR